jgi:hypothetical protein
MDERSFCSISCIFEETKYSPLLLSVEKYKNLVEKIVSNFRYT